MINKLLSLLPEKLIKKIGLLQFRLPVFGPVIGWLAKKLISGKGTIQYGIGRGLKFNSAGGASGFVLGTTDPLEQEALVKYLKNGDCFINIGANMGFFSILAKNIVGKNGDVFAFEPVPIYAERIKENAKLNDMEVTVIQKAVFNKNGRTNFDLSGVTSSLIWKRGEMTEVETVKLDDLIESGVVRKPNYCVIDVEGAELEVLEGMRKTIEICKPVILVEIHWLGIRFISFYEENLAPLGYEIKNLDPNKGIVSESERWHAVLVPRR